MAHGGHHGGSHHSSSHHSRSHHSRRRNGSSTRKATPFNFFVLIFMLVFSACSVVAELNPRLGSGKPLNETHKVIEFITDEYGYITDSDELLSGLKYFYEKTNVQMVVVTTNEAYSDSKAVTKYYELCNDEAHVVVIVPIYGNITYYAIGDSANSVINDKGMDYLLNMTNNTKSGYIWKSALTKTADKIIK